MACLEFSGTFFVSSRWPSPPWGQLLHCAAQAVQGAAGIGGKPIEFRKDFNTMQYTTKNLYDKENIQ